MQRFYQPFRCVRLLSVLHPPVQWWHFFERLFHLQLLYQSIVVLFCCCTRHAGQIKDSTSLQCPEWLHVINKRGAFSGAKDKGRIWLAHVASVVRVTLQFNSTFITQAHSNREVVMKQSGNQQRHDLTFLKQSRTLQCGFALREPQGRSTQSLQHAILFCLLLKRGYNIIDFVIDLPIAPKIRERLF